MRLAAKSALAAEAWGTFLLTLIGSGSIITLTYTGIDSGARLGFIGLAHGVALIAAAYSIGHVTGAHINPAVTLAHWATGRLERARAVPYLTGQFIGATIASLIQLTIWAQSPFGFPVAKDTFLGNTSPNPGFSLPAVFFAELIGTSILVFTIFGATDRSITPQSNAGLSIGFVLAGIIWMFGPISGASLNPARTWGPTIVSTYFTSTPLAYYWIYLTAPILGGLLGGFLYDIMRHQVPSGARVEDSSEKSGTRST